MKLADTSLPTPPGGKELAGQARKRGPSTWQKASAALLLLVCIVGGIFLISQSLRSSPPVVGSGNTSVLPKPWCAAPAALSTDFSGTSLSGLAENDVWSTGAQISYWNGHKWGVAFGPLSQQDVFHSLVEVAPNNVWVVGEQMTGGLPSHTLTFHWGGMGWQTVNSPDAVAGGKNTLVAVSAASVNDVWAVGFYVPQQGPLGPLIEHWNGTQWSVVAHLDTPVGTQFTSVKALSSNDAWAVGYASTSSDDKTSTQPVTEHWNGTQWSAIANPDLSAQGGGNLYAISGSSASDLWAVGSTNKEMLSEHWDGRSWSLIASPAGPSNNSNWLASVAASAPDNAWAVGRVGGSNAGFRSFIEHWNGHQWQIVQNPEPDTGELNLVAVVGHQFWIAGIPQASGGHAFIETICP